MVVEEKFDPNRLPEYIVVDNDDTFVELLRRFGGQIERHIPLIRELLREFDTRTIDFVHRGFFADGSDWWNEHADDIVDITKPGGWSWGDRLAIKLAGEDGYAGPDSPLEVAVNAKGETMLDYFVEYGTTDTEGWGWACARRWLELNITSFLGDDYEDDDGPWTWRGTAKQLLEEIRKIQLDRWHNRS